MDGGAWWAAVHGVRSEERRVGKSVDLGGRRIIKKVSHILPALIL